MQKIIFSLLSLVMLSLSSPAFVQSATLKIGDVVTQTGSDVFIPVYADFSEIPGGVSGFDLYIQFDSSELGFLGTDSLHPMLADAFSAKLRANNPEMIQISWIDFSFSNPLFLKDTLFYLHMRFTGNECSTLDFVTTGVQSELINADGMEIAGVNYADGSVCSDGKRRLIIQVAPEHLTDMANPTGAGDDYETDDMVDIAVSEVSGYAFTGWQTSSDDRGLIADSLALQTTFMMPARTVTLTATYEPIPYTLEIAVLPEELQLQAQRMINGNPFDQDSIYQFFAEELVAISVEPVEGYLFDGWSSQSGHLALLSDTLSLSASFVMPASDLSFTAHYSAKPPPVFSVTFTVQNQQGSPIEDAGITFNDVTNALGEYLFAGILSGTYTYEVKKEGYFDATGFIFVEDEDVVVAVTLIINDVHVNQPEDTAFRVYPNPAKSLIHIETGAQMEQVMLINANGQLVDNALPANTNTYMFPVTGLSPGVYYIRVLTKYSVYTKPFHLVR